MKYTLATLIAAISASAFADPLTLQITEVREANGNLMIAIVDSVDAFDDKAPPIASLILPARLGAVSFTTDALPAGDYAVRVMHDVNGNGKLDANFVGMPTEPYGFSNNASGSFGPPKWDAARFSVDSAGTTQTIALSH